MRAARPKRKCRVVACANPLRAGYLMCPSCWRSLPREAKKLFREAVRSGDTARIVQEADNCVALAGRNTSPLLPELAG